MTNKRGGEDGLAEKFGLSPRDFRRFPPMPRVIKYAWGGCISGLLIASIFLGRDSAWLPILNQAIDLLQEQNSPTQSK